MDLQQNQAETRWGADIGITASVTPEFELRAGYAWVMVEEDGFQEDDQLGAWLNKAKAFAKTLPAK